MNFIAPEQVVLYLIDIVFLLFGLTTLGISYQMITSFDFNSSTSYQYNLEKKNILVSNIVTFLIFFKIPLLFFFLYFIDSLAPTIPGAMCAVGVLNSDRYGAFLIILKVVNIFLLGYWYYINRFDLRTYGFIYTKLKYKLLIFVILMVVLEFLLEFRLFNSISPTKIVSCCGSIFGGEVKSYSLLWLDFGDRFLLISTFGVFILLGLSYIFKIFKFYGVLSIFFLIVSVYSLIGFFSPYIYELPTHKCPFCILQKDYYYIGYLIYFLLLGGSFYGSNLLVLSKFLNDTLRLKWCKISFYLFTIYLLVVSSYVILYFVRNGVWLTE